MLKKKRTIKRKAKRNPGKRGLRKATPAEQKQYEAIKKAELKRGVKLADAKRIAAATVRARAKSKRNPSYTVEAIPKFTDTVRETVSAFTSGSAIRKVKKKVAGPKDAYRYRVEKNTSKKRKRRSNKPAHISLSDLSKFPPAVQAKIRSQLGQVEQKEKQAQVKVAKARTPTQRKAATKAVRSAEKARRSWLSKLGTKLRAISSTSVFRISARDSNRCKRRVFKVRARTMQEAVSTLKRKIGSGYDDFRIGNPTRKKAKKKVAAKRTVKRRNARHESGLFYRVFGGSDNGGSMYKEEFASLADAKKFVQDKKAAALKGKSGLWGYWVVFREPQGWEVYRTSTTTQNPRRKTTKTRRHRNETPEGLRREFAGRYNKDDKLYFPEGTPQGLAKLGKLLKIKTTECVIEPNSKAGEVWLCADTNKRLHLGATVKARIYDGPAGDLGEVKQIEYRESKPHLGYGITDWFHKMGENGGHRPVLVANRKGELKFRGGDYNIKREGIEG